jgi:16S rRNA (guanine527-N7)-methyltransferase
MEQPISSAWVNERLERHGIPLPAEVSGRLACYLRLLQKWNAKVNLTAIRDVEASFKRNFVESLWLLKGLELKGKLLDVGSGAGFPGLVLKAAVPELQVTLLEPVAKKRAFLAEVSVGCGIGSVGIMGMRLEDLKSGFSNYDFVTARAVGNLPGLIEGSGRLLAKGGRICLWVSSQQVVRMQEEFNYLQVEKRLKLPTGDETLILIGNVRGNMFHVKHSSNPRLP